VHKVGPGVDTEYVFDARDRLVEVKEGGSSVARYGYDSQNLRVYMKDGGGERRVLLDGVEEMGEYEVGALSRVARFDHDSSRVDALLAQSVGSKTFAHGDALGSVYGLTDANASVQARYGYDVFGTRTTGTDAVATPWGYTGRRHDSTGETYARARYLDLIVGRWRAADPIGVLDGSNRYVYVRARPVVATDPLGLYGLYQVRTTGPGACNSAQVSQLQGQLPLTYTIDIPLLANWSFNYAHTERSFTRPFLGDMERYQFSVRGPTRYQVAIFECACSDVSRGGGILFGHSSKDASSGLPLVTLYPAYFRAPGRIQAGTIVHELGHVAVQGAPDETSIVQITRYAPWGPDERLEPLTAFVANIAEGIISGSSTDFPGAQNFGTLTGF
jgi:RHS repeat-associated protein